MRLCKFTFTVISFLPCLHTFWHAIPTSFYIFKVFKSCRTRWIEWHNALEAFVDLYPAIVEAMHDITLWRRLIQGVQEQLKPGTEIGNRCLALTSIN